MGLKRFIKRGLGLMIFVAFGVLVMWRLGLKHFDEDQLNMENIYGHIEALTGAEYEGRLAGSSSDEAARIYIEDFFEQMGVLPGGENGSYEQVFSTIVPHIDMEPIFNLEAEDGSILERFTLYEDFSVLASDNGGSIDYLGDLIFVGSDLYRIDPEWIKDRVVVIEGFRVDPARISYVKANGGKGILSTQGGISFNSSTDYSKIKSVNTFGKTGSPLLVGYLSSMAYRKLIEYDTMTNLDSEGISLVKNVRIKVDMAFPIVETANVFGKIEGRNPDGGILLLMTSIDGVGVGPGGSYFQGAVSNTTGIAILLELARVMSLQDDLPYKSVVIAGFNAEQQYFEGVSHYIKHPIYPLEMTEVIDLSNIGARNMEGISIMSDQINSRILSEKIKALNADLGVPLTERYNFNSGSILFLNEQVPTVLLVDDNLYEGTYLDVPENMNKSKIEETVKVLMKYLKHEVYRDNSIDYLNTMEKAIILLLFVTAVINMIFTKAYEKNPASTLFRIPIEDIYYAAPVILLRKFFRVVLPFFAVVFLLALLANIDPSTNIMTINGQMTTNISPYLTLKQNVLYIREMLNPALHSSYKAGNIFKLIYSSSILSIQLIVSSLVLSTTLGIFWGMTEGYLARKRKMGSLITLILFSVPDVLVVMLFLRGYTLLINSAAVFQGLNRFVLPLVSLSIIPAIYISRITFVTVQEELIKDYTRNAKAKGLSRKRLIYSELLPAVAFNVVDSLPAIMTMIFSNMIIVEYLFNYKGIVNYLLYLYNRQDIYRFVPLAISLGLIYILLTWGIQQLAKHINPLKREEAK